MGVPPDTALGSNAGPGPTRLGDAQLASILARAADAVIATDAAQRITFFNEGAESMFGFRAAEVVGRGLDLLIPAGWRPHLDGNAAAAAVSQADRRMGDRRAGTRRELAGVRRGGERFPVEALLLTLETDAGPMCAAVLHDLSEQRQGEETARQNEEQFRLLVEAVRDYAIFRLDPSGYVASWNTGAALIKGYSAEEIIGQHFSIFYPPDVVARGWPRQELELAERDGRFEDEGWRLRKDGSRFWANVVITALRAKDGRLVGFGKVTRDLTERLHTEQQTRELIRAQAARAEAELAAGRLRESEARFRAMADTAPVLIWTADPQGRCDWFNRPWLEFTGRRMEDELGEGWAEGIHAGEREACVATYRAAFRDRQPFRMEYRLRRHDGEYRWVLDHGVPRFTPDGTFTGFIGSCTDTHEQIEQQRALAASAAHLEELTTELEHTVDELQTRTAEEQAARAEAELARQQAEEASRAKSQFLAVMSHELRTPLNVVLGFVDLLAAELAGPLTETQREHLQRIQSSSWHLLELINRVLSLSRIEAGKEDLHIEEADAVALARESAALIEPAARKKELDLRLVLPDPPLAFRTDPGKVRQILLNLLNNAVKYTDDGAIELRLDAEDGWLRFEVHDTGIGIDAEHAGRVFEPFTQVEPASPRGRGGTGLGLSVTRELVRLLEGEIALTSEPGRGSRFVVRLPSGADPKADLALS